MFVLFLVGHEDNIIIIIEVDFLQKRLEFLRVINGALELTGMLTWPIVHSDHKSLVIGRGVVERRAIGRDWGGLGEYRAGGVLHGEG
jgi:hypothetical protein